MEAKKTRPNRNKSTKAMMMGISAVAALAPPATAAPIPASSAMAIPATHIAMKNNKSCSINRGSRRSAAAREPPSDTLKFAATPAILRTIAV